jgi:hypothetical protein
MLFFTVSQNDDVVLLFHKTYFAEMGHFAKQLFCFKSQRFQKSPFSKVNDLKKQRFQKSTLSKANA